VATLSPKKNFKMGEIWDLFLTKEKKFFVQFFFLKMGEIWDLFLTKEKKFFVQFFFLNG